MIKYVLSFACALVMSNAVSALTLEEAVQATLRTNPDILANKSNLEAAQQVRRQAQGAYLPSVDLVLAGGRERSRNPTTLAAGFDQLTLTRKERGVTITQLLYDGAQTSSLVEQQSAAVDSSLARLASSRESVSLQAIQLYLEVLRRNEVVKLAEENLKQHDATLEKIKERFESGVGTKVDVVQTEGRRALSQSNVLQAQRDVKDGTAQFMRVVGEPPADLTEPTRASGLPPTLDAALDIAYKHNPALLAAEADLKVAVAAHDEAKGLFKPRVDLQLGATRNNNIDGSEGPNDDKTAMVRMTYNLYRGGVDSAKLHEAEAREYAARENVASVKRGVTQDVTVVWDQLQDISQRLDYLQTHVKSTEQVLDVYNQQMTLGKRTLLDLLDIENELLKAQIAYATGRYTEMLARYQVLASIGTLLDNMKLQSVQ